ncbi:hypothetical protein N0V83_004603 [Neocucurbitaria cava]|uniref:Uncharacterized protein n=1 Tax=Neocucurbitaria cava TaxID=798079 RepID=A0A9W9CN55_9PLEO|nr:hypothetical protein N0V83_004603 [Neocucurbitaria cava]
MALEGSDPIFCDKLGNSTSNLPCCYPDNQNTTICRTIFDDPNVFSGACDTTGNCLNDCQSISVMYSSKTQDDSWEGNGRAPIRRYLTCANVPNMAGYLNQNDLGSNILPRVEKYIPQGEDVFASYLMQCMFVVVLWFGLTSFEVFKKRRAKQFASAEHAADQPKEKSTLLGLKLSGSKGNDVKRKHTHQDNFESFLVQFHQAQCYFSATIQIASLTYGIFDADMLNTFLLLPLATNGVLPVVFGYVLLLRCRKASMDATMLTTLCWLLASLVYWVLYTHIIPINSEIQDENKIFRAYQQFMFKLSAVDACGGYSALAVCPNNIKWGKDQIVRASHRLRVLTPIIWTFSTVCVLIALAEKVHRWLNRPSARRAANSTGDEQETEQIEAPPQRTEHSARSPFANTVIYGVITMCFLAGVGMQLSLLSVATSLKMMDRNDWGFGQIVAITIWVPPLLGYMYDTIKVFVPPRFKTGTFRGFALLASHKLTPSQVNLLNGLQVCKETGLSVSLQ